MPAVVRGGKRQPNASTGAPSGASTKGNGGAQKRNGRAIIGKGRAAGSVRMSPETTAWLAAIVLVFLLSAILFTGNRIQALSHAATQGVDQQISRVLGLKINNLQLVGVSDRAMPAVMKALKFEKGQPFALMDLAEVQSRLKLVGWVKSATVRRKFPDTLVVSVVERPTLAIWNHQGQLYVIDDRGVVIPEAHASDFPNLFLVAGEGANESAMEIISLVQSRPDLAHRVMGFTRIDTRRWDIRLNDHTVIKLPARDPEHAMEQLDKMIEKGRILDQGLAYIDLRDPKTTTVGAYEGSSALSSVAATAVKPTETPPAQAQPSETKPQ